MAVLREKLEQLLAPVVTALGYELVLLEFSPNSKHGLLRLYIDTAAGITVEDCEKVSREVAATLDVEDPISTAYSLEVSSPGLDRPLVRPEHYVRFLNEQARIQLVAPLNGRRRFVGWIRNVTDSAVSLQTAEGSVDLPFAEIERARLVPEYDRE